MQCHISIVCVSARERARLYICVGMYVCMCAFAVNCCTAKIICNLSNTFRLRKETTVKLEIRQTDITNLQWQ